MPRHNDLRTFVNRTRYGGLFAHSTKWSIRNKTLTVWAKSDCRRFASVLTHYNFPKTSIDLKNCPDFSLRLKPLPSPDIQIKITPAFVDFVMIYSKISATDPAVIATHRMAKLMPPCRVITFTTDHQMIAGKYSDDLDGPVCHSAPEPFEVIPGGKLTQDVSIRLKNLAWVIRNNRDVITRLSPLNVSGEGLGWLEIVSGDTNARYYFDGNN